MGHLFIGTDLLVLALKDFPSGKDIRLKEDFEDILCELSQNPEYAELFRNYPVNWSGAFPMSPEISKAIDRLYTIEGFKENSVEKTVRITGCIQIIYERVLQPKITTEQKDLCEKFSKDVQQYLV